MTSRRIEKVAQAIREAVSSAILFELRDPRVKNVTILSVEVSGDVRSAKVYVSIMGNEREQALTLQGLNSSRGFLQSKIADRIKTRYTPILKFVADQSVKRSIETAKALMQLEGENPVDDNDVLSTENIHVERESDTPISIEENEKDEEPSLDDGDAEINDRGSKNATSISSQRSTTDS